MTVFCTCPFLVGVFLYDHILYRFLRLPRHDTTNAKRKTPGYHHAMSMIDYRTSVPEVNNV